ncbi:hypothetical protein AKJ65_04700 [candidate division MSBL1 archaeon SCGC-AAA259E19]|uniref:AAA+ ATPase domain-containing protein n=1 Tax=candidate division MSBL1 archaeon SCGC-AAA259E19 TaxID=1698264 RepID=A0A133UJE2_9EURY|nr:hypothetical protein AKJ65_04700 [candidate division MSBL1 archaeon SCGC-AAA259E19]
MPEKMNKPMQVERIKQFLANHNVDPKTVDTEALVDGSLHFDENFEEIKDSLQITTEEELMEGVREWEEREQERRREEFREEFKESLEEVKESGKDVAQYYGRLRAYVRATVNGGPDSLILFSRPGLGKSYQVMSVLKEEGLERGEDYELVNGYSTPLELYHQLYENRDKVLILDDVDGIASSRKALSLLQAATWSASGDRVVNYKTTSGKLDAPQEFKFEGSIIICLNRESALPELRALKSRSIFHRLELTHQELVNGIFPKIAEKELDGGSEELVEFIKENSNPASELEIRDLMKSIDLYEYANGNGVDWKELVSGIINADEELTLVWNLMKNGNTTKENVKKFRKETGKSRQTFFNKKKKLKKLVEK